MVLFTTQILVVVVLVAIYAAANIPVYLMRRQEYIDNLSKNDE